MIPLHLLLWKGRWDRKRVSPPAVLQFLHSVVSSLICKGQQLCANEIFTWVEVGLAECSEAWCYQDSTKPDVFTLLFLKFLWFFKGPGWCNSPSHHLSSNNTNGSRGCSLTPPPPFPFQYVPPEAGEVPSLAADCSPSGVPTIQQANPAWKGCLLHHPGMEKGRKKGHPNTATCLACLKAKFMTQPLPFMSQEIPRCSFFFPWTYRQTLISLIAG